MEAFFRDKVILVSGQRCIQCKNPLRSLEGVKLDLVTYSPPVRKVNAEPCGTPISRHRRIKPTHSKILNPLTCSHRLTVRPSFHTIYTVMSKAMPKEIKEQGHGCQFLLSVLGDTWVQPIKVPVSIPCLSGPFLIWASDSQTLKKCLYTIFYHNKLTKYNICTGYRCGPCLLRAGGQPRPQI